MVSSTLICNPAAGRGGWWQDGPSPRLLSLLETLRGRGFEPTLEITSAAGHAHELARLAAEGGERAVFALGGDGTLREVAMGLVGSDTALGILPAGTANVLGIALNLPRKAKDCAAAYDAERLTSKRIDVGRCGATTRFLMMASFGLDARTLHNLSPDDKRRFGRLAISWQAMRELARGVPSALTYRRDDQPLETASFFAVCNIEYYGGPFRLARGALPDDGYLDTVALEGGRRRHLAALFRVIFSGKLPIRRARRVVIDGGNEIQLQVDGDPVSLPLPLEVTVEPSALRVLTPSNESATAH